MKTKYVFLTLLTVLGAIGINAVPPVSAGENCSPPIDYDENYLLERCEGGSYLIDKQDGSKQWVKDDRY